MGRRTGVAAGLAALGIALGAGAPAGARAVAPACDSLDTAACLLPFPNDSFTRADPSTPTGRRVAFARRAMPRNVAGRAIDPTDWNRADGFSPGALIVTKVPGLDDPQALARTRAVPITDLARTYDRDTPVVLIDAATRRRQLIWVELDSSVAGDADRTLLIRPAKNLLEGHRYIVALRRLRDRNGAVIPPGATFKAFRDRTRTPRPADERRRAHFEDLFATLGRAGIAREDLYLAWDFTVASAASLAGRMLHIRNDAFHELGDDDLADLKVAGRPPDHELTTVPDEACKLGVPLSDLTLGFVRCGTETNDKIVRDIKGTMTVPCYVDAPGCLPAHSQFLISPRTGMPVRIPGNVMRAEFECRVPRTASAANPARISLYGHGLFGSYGEVRQGQLQDFAVEHNIVFCATDWAGMATFDVPNVVTVLTDLSNFPTLADRIQQGFLNFLYLGRLMLHPEGLAAEPAFQDGGRPLIDTRELYYDGNSQGGIYGGALTAVAPDFTRATLGVPGMNYSTLLSRSADFGTGADPDVTKLAGGDLPFEYAYPLYRSYPREVQRQLIFSLMQMLWDRADPDGYAQHMTDHPLPDTPAHEVMLHVALGDHQVAPVSAEVEARTIGARVLRRVDPARSSDRVPQYGLREITRFPASGSALVVWDSGSPVPPVTNTPPTAGKDPHEHPRRTPAARAMKSAFLAPDSRIVDTCGGQACRAVAGD